MSRSSAVSITAHRECALCNVSVRFDGAPVLDGVDLVVGPTDRLAVIGDNGSGKSTLLNVLAGAVPVGSGERRVVIPGGVAYADQHPVFAPGATITAAIDQLLTDLRDLERQIAATVERLAVSDDPDLLTRLGELMDEFESRDGYRVDQRVDEGLEHLGLGGIDRRRRVATLSGGERARLALAVVLASDAELLLLDEPTNDLDDTAVAWLTERLRAHRGALLVVTHDRAFLDDVASDILVVDSGRLHRYGDGYAGYRRARETELRVMRERYDAWQADVRRCSALVETNARLVDAIPRRREKPGFGHGSFRARSRDHGAVGRIRMAKERLERLHADPAPRPPDPLRFTPTFAAVDPECPLLSLGGRTVRPGDRVLVTGPNGAGKTTLLRTIAGEVDGDVRVEDGVRIAWLRQDLQPPSGRSVLDEYAARTGRHFDDAADRLRSTGLLDTVDWSRRVRELSVGQRRRLDLAVVLDVPSDVLLLDEPTNHLAPDLVDQLQDAIDDYPGTVVTVTHDRRWRERWADRMVVDLGRPPTVP